MIIDLMDPIVMVDLKGQYQKIKNEVDAAVLDVIASSAFINGPAVGAFQKDFEAYLGIDHIIPCANGTSVADRMMASGLSRREVSCRHSRCRDGRSEGMLR